MSKPGGEKAAKVIAAIGFGAILLYLLFKAKPISSGVVSPPTQYLPEIVRLT